MQRYCQRRPDNIEINLLTFGFLKDDSCPAFESPDLKYKGYGLSVSDQANVLIIAEICHSTVEFNSQQLKLWEYFGSHSAFQPTEENIKKNLRGFFDDPKSRGWSEKTMLKAVKARVNWTELADEKFSNLLKQVKKEHEDATKQESSSQPDSARQEQVAEDLEMVEVNKTGAFLGKMCQLERDLTFLFVYYGDLRKMPVFAEKDKDAPSLDRAPLVPQTLEEARGLYEEYIQSPPKVYELPWMETRAGLLFSTLTGQYAEAGKILETLFKESDIPEFELNLLQASFPILMSLYNGKSTSPEDEETRKFIIMA